MIGTSKRFTDYLPILETLRGYGKRTFRGDLYAGITVAIMLIPQGMAYAVLAGLPPVYGLYASIVPVLVYAVFGTSRQLAVGPVALVSILVLAGVSQHAAAGSMRFVQLAILTGFGAGLVQLLMGFFKMGFLVNFLSRPVLNGFVSAAAIIIAVSQFGNLLGLNISGNDNVFYILWQTVSGISSEFHGITALFGCGSLFLIYGLKRWKKKLPAALIVVISGIVFSFWFDLENTGLQVVGEIPTGLPSFSLVSISPDDLGMLWPIILTIALISFVESIALAKSIAVRRGYKIDPDQELIGLGAAKLAGSFFQAFPTTGGFSRTAVNDQSGASTQVSGVISAVLVGVTVLFLTPFFYYLPIAVLAAIIIMSILSLFEFHQIKFLWKTDRKDLAMLAVTFVATLIFGIKEGILVGVVLSLAVVIYSSTKPHTAELGRLGNTKNFRNINRYKEARTDNEILIFRFDSSLYFANVEHFIDFIEAKIEKKGEDLELVILDASAINSVDSTGIYTLQELIRDLKVRRITFYIAGAIGPVRDKLKASGITESMGEENFFFDVDDAMVSYKENKHLEPYKKYSPLQTNF